MPNSDVLEQFPTERYKRFYYPNKPFFSMLKGFCIVGLGLIGLLPMKIALWFSASLGFDDLPLTPILYVTTAINNLVHGRKKLKSTIMISVVISTAIIGTILGFFVLSQLPFVTLGLASFIAQTSCPPILISAGAIFGSLFAHFTNKISPFAGAFIGTMLVPLLPIHVPLLVDIVFISATVMSLIAGIITKGILKLYNKYKYGHSNADGYNMDRLAPQQSEFIKNQAKALGYPDVIAFKKLLTKLKNEIKSIKKNAYYYQELIGTRHEASNTYKNIYHGLMIPNITKKQKALVKNLLKKCTNNAIQKAIESLQEPYIKIGKLTISKKKKLQHLTLSGSLRDSSEQKMLHQQISMPKGIDPVHSASCRNPKPRRTITNRQHLFQSQTLASPENSLNASNTSVTCIK